MIKLEDICYIKQGGWKINLYVDSLNTITLKGQVYPDERTIELYLWNIVNQKDFDLTILHEFQHIHDLDIMDDFGGDYEQLTEQKAKSLYDDFPEVLDKIKKEYPTLTDIKW